MHPLADDVGKGLLAPKDTGQLSEIQNHEETAAELCLRADAEQDFDRLLELATKIQQLIEVRWYRNHTLKSPMPLRKTECLPLKSGNDHF